ncbi:MAG TPA: glycosyltransferase family 2 protein [Elusimicrobia bacterium]|nr:glycosyltransferase family 2 protein [Elusimicrobiota bacterium]
MKLSIIIVNYNTKTLLDECLGSIYRNPPTDDFEIVVVDNASEDGSVELVQNKYPGVKIVKNEKNLGFAKANNIGIRISRGKYVILLNSDTKILNSSLDKMLDYIDTHPSVGIVGPKLIGEGEEIIQMSWHWYPTIFKEAVQKILAPQYISKYKIMRLVVEFLVRKKRNVELVPGACMLVRKKVFDDVGLLDENLFLYFEEPDFCMRVRNAGWKIVFLPEAKVIHKLGQTMKKIGKETLIIYRESQLYFYKKHNSKLQQKLLRLFLWVKFSYLKLSDFSNSAFYNKILDMVKNY